MELWRRTNTACPDSHVAAKDVLKDAKLGESGVHASQPNPRRLRGSLQLGIVPGVELAVLHLVLFERAATPVSRGVPTDDQR